MPTASAMTTGGIWSDDDVADDEPCAVVAVSAILAEPLPLPLPLALLLCSRWSYSLDPAF